MLDLFEDLLRRAPRRALRSSDGDPPPEPLRASAIESAFSVGIPNCDSDDSRWDLFCSIRIVPSSASPKLAAKLRTVCVIPVTSP